MVRLTYHQWNCSQIMHSKQDTPKERKHMRMPKMVVMIRKHSTETFKKASGRNKWTNDLELFRLFDNTPVLYKDITNVWRIFTWFYCIPTGESSTEGYGNKMGMRLVRSGQMDPLYVKDTEICADNLPPLRYRDVWTSEVSHEIYKEEGGTIYSDPRSLEKYEYNVIVDPLMARTHPYYEYLKQYGRIKHAKGDQNDWARVAKGDVFEGKSNDNDIESLDDDEESTDDEGIAFTLPRKRKQMALALEEEEDNESDENHNTKRRRLNNFNSNNSNSNA
eukprot:903083_1